MLTRRRRMLVVSLALPLLISCAQTQTSRLPTNASHSAVSSTPPFETREPERYRATRITTTVSAGATPVVTKNSIARDGELRRDESETLGRRYVLLVSADGKFLLFPDEKVFASVPNEDAGAADQDSDTSPDRLLHTEPLTTSFESLGAESVNGRETQKYRVVANSSRGESVNDNGETFLWFDEALRMPVKTESRSPDGTRVTTELVDVVLEIDGSLFQIPKDYQQIEFKKARERLRPNQP